MDVSEITILSESDEFSEQEEMILNETSSKLRKNNEFGLIVEGYTDRIGDESLNVYLSRLRAQSVKSYSISQGIQAHRLNAVGYGESVHIASNNIIEGRAKI